MAKRARTKVATASTSRIEDHASKDNDSESDNEDVESLRSDALDEDETPKKHGRTSSSKRTQKSTRSVSGKKTQGKKKRKVEDTAEDEHDSDVELKDGQEVVGKVVEAPTTGWAPEGQISQHTMDFLMRLQDPACNDRVWFRLHGTVFRRFRYMGVAHDVFWGNLEPVYRRCEKEFKSFVEAIVTMLAEVDSQIPPLPPKDVIHRIYRDVRFSNDKTPYKTVFSASFSRSGRKGTFAFYHVTIKPGDESLFAAGAWCPAKNELNMIRNHIKHSSSRLREIISDPEFVAQFGEPRPHPKGMRQNIFGAEDELKTAPKGVDKNHRDIDLLKCRSLTVFRKFTDDQVLTGTFVQDLEKVAKILRPFVHCLNDMMTLPVESDSGEDVNE